MQKQCCDGSGEIYDEQEGWSFCVCPAGIEASRKNDEVQQAYLSKLIRMKPIKRNTGKSFTLKLWSEP